MVQVALRLLLDTHALLWWVLGDANLSAAAGNAIADEQAEVFVSAVSAWELSIKFTLGKLPSATTIVTNFESVVVREGFRDLPITIAHGRRAGALPVLHKDPFDRMLIAQAQSEQLVLVSNEAIFDPYGLQRLW